MGNEANSNQRKDKNEKYVKLGRLMSCHDLIFVIKICIKID